MSQIFTLKGRTSTLSIDFTNPIELNREAEYGLALIGFHSYNSIPNIERAKFYYQDNKVNKSFDIPTGVYEIEDLAKYIRLQLNTKSEEVFSLKPNNNTLKCELRSTLYSIDFRPENSIGKLLGYSPRILEANLAHFSDLPVSIVKVRTVHIDCSITAGAFYHDRPSHTIYEFAIAVDPGYAIDEQPRNPIYLPVNKDSITNLTLTVLDQNFELINFQGEDIIIRVELKKLPQWA